MLCLTDGHQFQKTLEFVIGIILNDKKYNSYFCPKDMSKCQIILIEWEKTLMRGERIYSLFNVSHRKYGIISGIRMHLRAYSTNSIQQMYYYANAKSILQYFEN